jgi:hypothetical protein
VPVVERSRRHPRPLRDAAEYRDGPTTEPWIELDDIVVHRLAQPDEPGT